MEHKDKNGNRISIGDMLRWKEGRYGNDGSLFIVSHIKGRLLYGKRIGHYGSALIRADKAEIVTEENG